MFVSQTSSSSGSICVSAVQTGCCKFEFDSTYPVHLDGIIAQNEFYQSIENINRTMGNGRKYLWIAMFIFFIGMIASMGCFIAGAMTLNVDPLGGFPILFSVGIALSVVFSILFIIVVAIVRVQSMTRLRESIAKESKKYSIRSPKPCSWRLETSSYFGYGSNDVSTYYHILIDIGHSSGSTNGAFYSRQGPDGSAYVVSHQSSFSSSPPAYSNSSSGICQFCGAPRHDLSARFCPSCGQGFYKS